jgi:hypothetical protein
MNGMNKHFLNDPVRFLNMFCIDNKTCCVSSLLGRIGGASALRGRRRHSATKGKRSGGGEEDDLEHFGAFRSSALPEPDAPTSRHSCSQGRRAALVTAAHCRYRCGAYSHVGGTLLSHSIGSALSSRASITLDQTDRSCGVSGLSDAITSAVIRKYRMSSAESLKYSGCPGTFPDLTMPPEPDAPASRPFCPQVCRSG